jgi:regulator of sigma E protease
MLITIITFAVILLALVLIHEFGHFLVAKIIGVKVEEFTFGFPPRLASIKKGETEYSINALPIGGYVKLYGEDEAGGGRISNLKSQISNLKDEGRAYYAQKPIHKIYIGVAGVVMNALLAAFLFYIYFFISGFTTDLNLFPGSNPSFFLATETRKTDIIVSELSKGSPAEAAGIKVMSTIEKINGTAVLDAKQFVDIINADKGKQTALIWKDEKGKEHTALVTPRVNPPKGEGALGIAFFPYSKLTLSYTSPIQKVFSGIVHPVNLMKYNFEVIGSLVAKAFKTKNASGLSNGVAGPVGIYSIVGTIISIPNLKERILDLLNLAGILSISLAFFNILPIPALDGGRVFFVVIEMIIGKRLNPKFESLANSIGMALLLTLILLTTFHDILRQLSGKGF